MKDLCLICSGSVKKMNCYSHQCEVCGFYFSNLSSGFGQDVKGLENLRKQNFKKILRIILNLRLRSNLKSSPYFSTNVDYKLNKYSTGKDV